MGIDQLPLHELRAAIRANRVSFPSQTPVFVSQHQVDRQRRVVQLYFVLGWNSGRIGRRYGITGSRVIQILGRWTRRAVELGFIQHIPSVDECLSELPIPLGLTG
jgi:hypothetical protein